MPAGTIALTNNSTVVTGSGTNFTTELKANDFIVAVVGGVTYTLGVQAVSSATGVTLTTAYNGPTASGIAWTAVPNAALVGITAQVAADVAKAIRGLNLDKANWQQVYSASGNITVTLPDGSQYSGPSWNSVVNSVSGKMEKSQNLNDVSDKEAARKNIGVSYGKIAGTVAQGDDSRITGALQKSGGNMSATLNSDTQSGSFVATTNGRFSSGNNQGNTFGAAYLNSSQYMTLDVWGTPSNIMTRIVTWNTSYHVFGFYDNGNGTCDGSWIGASDERHKDNIELVKNPLKEVLAWRGCTYDKKDIGSSVGLIAQDVEKSCPAAVSNIGRREFSDGTVIDDFKALDTAGVAAAYHTESIKALFSLLELALTDPDSALKHIDEIKAAVTTPNSP